MRRPPTARTVVGPPSAVAAHACLVITGSTLRPGGRRAGVRAVTRRARRNAAPRCGGGRGGAGCARASPCRRRPGGGWRTARADRRRFGAFLAPLATGRADDGRA